MTIKNISALFKLVVCTVLCAYLLSACGGGSSGSNSDQDDTNLPDTIAPTLTLIGSSSINVRIGTNYIDQGASFTDNIDDARTVFSSDSINFNSLGAYSLNYTATDEAGNLSNTVTRTVNIIDSGVVNPNAINQSTFFVFGHSLFIYTGGDSAPTTNYTNVGEWLGVLADNSGTESSGGYRFGFTDAHNNLNWSSSANITPNGIFSLNNTSTFDSGFNGLAGDDIDHFYFMPSNYLGSDMGQFPFTSSTNNYRGDAEELIDNILSLFPASEQILYIHEPDAGPFGGADLSRSQFTTYNNATMNEYLDWHVRLQDNILANGRIIKSVPAGPVLAWLFENESYLQSVQFNQLYGDSAPHGSESIYFLKALVVYMSIYQQDPVVSGLVFPPGTTVRDEIQNNLLAIVSAIRSRLEFHQANGVNVYQ